jgi:hypothetical protein
MAGISSDHSCGSPGFFIDPPFPVKETTPHFLPFTENFQRFVKKFC